MRMGMRLVVGLAVAALALTGCGSADDTQAGPDERGSGWQTAEPSDPPTSEPTSTQPVEHLPQPCALMPPDVVAEILDEGVTVEWEDGVLPSHSLQCFYNTETTSVSFFISDASKLPIPPKTAEEALRGASGGNRLTLLHGIGDLAGYADGPLATVYVVNSTGSTIEVAQITGFPEQRDQLIRFAAELAARL